MPQDVLPQKGIQNAVSRLGDDFIFSRENQNSGRIVFIFSSILSLVLIQASPRAISRTTFTRSLILFLFLSLMEAKSKLSTAAMEINRDLKAIILKLSLLLTILNRVKLARLHQRTTWGAFQKPYMLRTHRRPINLDLTR